jgi:hypothetical protein
MTKKPTESEEEYFARLDMEKRKEMIARRAAEVAADERERLKQQHWMRCPKDGHELTTVRLQGVAVDTCAACGGTWLDAGEIDQVIANADTGPLDAIRRIFKG